MATPTPFAALANKGMPWQISNPQVPQQTSIPGTMTPFWGTVPSSQSRTAAAAQGLQSQLATSPASPSIIAATRVSMDLIAQFCLGLALLVTVISN